MHKTARVALMRLRDLIDRDPSVRVLQATDASLDQALSSLQMIDSYDSIAGVAPGALVVLSPALSADVASYRFDLGLGRLPDGVAGVALSSHAGEPSATALRTAERRDLALVALDPGADVAAIAVRVRDLSLGGPREAITRLETACRIVDSHDSAAGDLDQLLARLSAELGCDVTIEVDAGDVYALPLDTGSGQPAYLALDTTMPDTIKRAAMTYAGRAIEAILRHDFEEANFPVQSRGDLLNEFLLNDASTGADALARLRRSGFPVEGHHLAARVDLHNLASGSHDPADNYRRQLRAARLLSDTVSSGEDSWTTAGTNTAVLLVMSEHRRNSRHAETLDARLRSGLERLEQLDPSLQWAAGVGTVQGGASGLRNTVDEATSALRAAQAGGISNQLQHFDRLGFARALIRWYEVDDVRATIDEILAPLAQLGASKVAEAVHTLRTYLDSGQNVKTTAHRLHVHRNTVRYRINRILDVLDVDLADPEQRLLVELGTRAMRIS